MLSITKMKPKLCYILILILLLPQVAWANRYSEKKLLPYVSLLIRECGVWHWEYAYEIETVLRFGEEELAPLENRQDSIMVKKTLKYLRQHPNRYDYIFNNGAAFMIFRRHLFVDAHEPVNPQQYFQHGPEQHEIYFRRTPNVAYDSSLHILTDASAELSPIIGFLQKESRRNEADTAIPTWMAIEYNYKTGRLTNYIDGRELIVEPEYHDTMMSQFRNFKAKFPQVEVLRFCLYCSKDLLI